MNTSITAFVDKLIEEKKIGAVDPEVKAQLAEDLGSRVEDRLNAAIITNLPKEKIAEFEKLLDDADAEKIQTFVAAHIPNIQEILAMELLQFRNTYING